MRILGLDFGKQNVRAIEVDSAFGRYEIHDYHERQVQPGETLSQAMTSLITSLPKKPDRIVCMLPSSQVTFRNLQIPTRDKKSINAAVQFELEDELPFELKDATYDHSVLAQQKTAGARSGTHLHIAATLKKYVSEALAEWQKNGIDPDFITSEAWAFRSLINRIQPKSEQEQPSMILHIGSGRTIIYVHHEGVPVLSREIAWGGDDLTAAIAALKNLNAENSEKFKLDNGIFVDPSEHAQTSPEQKNVSEALTHALQPLLIEIRQSDFACKRNTQLHIDKIYTSGKTTLLPGFRKMLERETHIEARAFQPLSAVSAGGLSYSELTEASMSLASAAAFCLVGTDKSTPINLRKGEFAKSKNTGPTLNLGLLKKPALALAITMSFLFTSGLIQKSIYQSRIEDIDSRLKKSVQGFFSQIPKATLTTYLSDTDKLKAAIDKELKKQKEVARLFEPDTKSGLAFLKTLSMRIPKGIVVDMVTFQVGASATDAYQPGSPKETTLTFLVNTAEMADKIAGILEPMMTKMQRGKPVEVPPTEEGQPAKWRVAFSGLVQENAYAQ